MIKKQSFKTIFGLLEAKKTARLQHLFLLIISIITGITCISMWLVWVFFLSCFDVVFVQGHPLCIEAYTLQKVVVSSMRKEVYSLSMDYVEGASNARQWTNVGLMLGQRRRRWTNIKPTLAQRLVSDGLQ